MAERLPPLQALAFFEAAARHGNFTAAARELHTTQPAVSLRISQLETDLGVTLFLRQHRGVSLSDAGHSLYEAVSSSLSTIRAVSSRLRAHRQRKTLTIATDFGFASYWLSPRLSALNQALPGVDVRIVSSQENADLLHGAADIAIEFGAGTWAGCTQEKLFSEQVVPVCSPAFLSAQPQLRQGTGLASATLLHVQNTNPARWLCWDDWFRERKVEQVPSGREMTFNNYSLVIESARAGQGVALGWHPLIDSLLQSGQLVAIDPQPMQTSRGYFLLQPHGQHGNDLAQGFRQWIVHECGAQKK
jgi:LysR family glycine cleavage system transcriptional activator